MTIKQNHLDNASSFTTIANALATTMSWGSTLRGHTFWKTVHAELVAEAKRQKALGAEPRVSHLFTDDESRLIRAISWQSGFLHVLFKNGQTYNYQDVPKIVFDEFVRASSPGKFFNNNVKGKLVQHYSAA